MQPKPGAAANWRLSWSPNASSPPQSKHLSKLASDGEKYGEIPCDAMKLHGHLKDTKEGINEH